MKNRRKIISKEIDEMQEFYDMGNSIKVCSLKFNIPITTLRRHITVRSRQKACELDGFRRRKVEAVTAWRIRRKKQIIEYKGGSCQICGYNRCINALELHHLDRNKKDFTISRKSSSFENMKSEIDKCILVCSNCHREIHEKEGHKQEKNKF